MWEANRNRDGNTSDSEAAMKSAVFNFVFFVMLKNKIEQSAKTKLLLNNPTDRTFENRWSRYKEPSKNKAEAYLVYVEHLFLRSDAGDARIFSKEEDVYGIDYGFGLDAPKETEQMNPQDLFAYRRNYTWTYKSKTAKLFLTMYNNFLTQQVLKGLNEKNLLTKSSDKNYTVHYRYGEDGQRGLKYTEEGRSETLYFNNFFTIHIPIYDKDNPQGLRVHKHIFVGSSRLVTAMTHTDNHGDNDEQKEKRYYYHSDHLGSAQFVTDWRGKQYEHIEYTPYGELWVEETAPGIDKLPFRFTGKELDEETGLYYYGARYLDPKYSRWLSGDPALGEYIPKAPIDDEAKKHNENLPGMGGIYNTVNLHVYHYAGNNPVKYIDPDGRLTADEETAKKIENLGKNAPGKLIDEILLKLKEDGWTIVTNEEKKEVHDDLKGSASNDNKDMMVSIDSKSITIKKDFTEEEKDQIELNKKIDAIPNNSLYKRSAEKLKRDVKPKDIPLTMIIFKVNPYDFEKKQIVGNYKEYIDIDNDGNIDGYKYK
ncbi:RHS repeat domain-containing protein [Treponema pedis]|uniref:RHS repeat domain-containing protein n=1 Tax=Treponema pedis TaxID=409322 RepID=UPI002091671E|nr:RHS repeat-associated core domain-containing protein [Treponema pedis]